MLKKEYRYASTPPLGLHGLFKGELCLFLLVSSLSIHHNIRFQFLVYEDKHNSFKAATAGSLVYLLYILGHSTANRLHGGRQRIDRRYSILPAGSTRFI